MALLHLAVEHIHSSDRLLQDFWEPSPVQLHLIVFIPDFVRLVAVVLDELIE